MDGKTRTIRLNLKKFVYLISPDKIKSSFFSDLDKVLSSNKVKFFQLRLKNVSQRQVIQIGLKCKKITSKYNVKLIINDNFKIAKKINADGCHLGQTDGSIIKARLALKNKILGITCHGSKELCMIAKKNNADYIALGSFFNSKLKPNASKANFSILKWAKKNIKKEIVAIGGINNKNFKKLLLSGGNYIAISSFIWNNPSLNPKEAIKKIK